MKRVSFHSTPAWVALALIGLVVAVGVSYAASQLAKPKVGLTSEPISAVSELAPQPAPGKHPLSRKGATAHPKPTTPTPTAPPTPTTATPVPTPTVVTPAPTRHEADDSGGEDD